MSYLALGTLDPWNWLMPHTFDTDEVYVLRLPCSNLPLKDGADLLLFARAAGQGQDFSLDVRAVGATGEGSNWSVDVVMTSSSWRASVLVVKSPVNEMVAAIVADEQLHAAFPNLAIDADKAVFGELVGPKDAIDTWLSQPPLWVASLTGPKKRGGPTATFAKPVDLSVFKGQADQGRSATPWRVTTPSIMPHDKPDEASSVGWYILGGAAVLGLGLAIWSRSKKR